MSEAFGEQLITLDELRARMPDLRAREATTTTGSCTASADAHPPKPRADYYATTDTANPAAHTN